MFLTSQRNVTSISIDNIRRSIYNLLFVGEVLFRIPGLDPLPFLAPAERMPLRPE